MKPQQISSVIYGDTTTTTAQRQQRNNNTNNSSNSTSYSRSSYYNGSRSNYASRSQAYYQSYPYYRSNSTSRRMDSGGGGAGGSGGNLNNSNGNDGKGTNGGSGGSMSYSTGSGPYDDDFGFMESQRGILLETQFEGVTEEIDLDKEGFERQELKELRRRDQIRNWLCALRFSTRLLNLLLSLLVVIFAIDAYQIWEQSRYHRISRGRPGTAPYITAWPMKPYTLPVFLMIGFAATSIIINFITTVVSCCTCRRLPHKDGKFDVFSCVATSILTALWGLAAGLYHGLKKGKDLYSYSCSRVTLARTRHFPSIDFDSACNMHQMVLWASIAAFVINTLALGEIALVVKRRSIRKDMGLLEKLKV